MNGLWLCLWLWWHCKELMRNEVCPWNALLTQLMRNNELDETMMAQTPMLLSWGLPLKHGRHPLNVLEEENRDVHHPHSGKVHQHANVTREDL